MTTYYGIIGNEKNHYQVNFGKITLTYLNKQVCANGLPTNDFKPVFIGDTEEASLIGYSEVNTNNVITLEGKIRKTEEESKIGF